MQGHDRLFALEAENAELRSRLQVCEQSYALLQAEIAELRQHSQGPAMVATPAGFVERASANQVLKKSLDLLATEPDLNKFVGHVLTAIAQQFHSPLTEYWSQDEQTAYVELIYWEGRILDRVAIAQTFPCHAGLVGFQVPPAMIDNVPLCQRKKPIVYDDHSTNPFTQNLPWVIQELVPRSLLKEINVPLFLGETTIGALTIHVPREHQFHAEQVELAQSLAHQVTLAAEMGRLAEAAQQTALAKLNAVLAQEREQAALERVAEFAKANTVLQRSLTWLAREKDLTRFLKQTLLEIATVLKADLAHLFILHLDRQMELVARVIDGQLSETGTPTEPALFATPFPADITPIFRLMEAEDILLTLDLVSVRPELIELTWPDNYEWHIREGRKQIGCLVLKADDRSVGFLGFGFRDYCQLSQETRELVVALANQAALAILLSQLAEQSKQTAIAQEREQAARQRAVELAQANAALQQHEREVQHSYRLLSVVAQVTQDLLKNPDVEQAIAEALQRLGEASGASRMTLFQETPEPHTGRLQHHIMLEWTLPHVPRLIADPDTRSLYSDDYVTLTAKLYAGRSTSLHLRDYPAPAPAYWAKFGVQSRSIVPILIEGEYFGCVCFDDCFQYHPWSEQEMDILTAGAGAIGAALLRQRLGERLMQARADQERADELAKASAAMNRVLTLTARETGLDSLLSSVLAAIAEQFDAPLVEWWERLDQVAMAKRLSYLKGRLLQAEDMVGHHGVPPFHQYPTLGDCDPSGNEILTPYILDNIEQIPYAPEELARIRAWYGANGVCKALNVPVVVEQRSFGALVILVPAHRRFTETQIQFASGMAQHLALAVLVSNRAEEAKQAAIVREQEKAAQERVAELATINQALTQRDRLLSAVAQVTHNLLENPQVEQAIALALQKLGQAAGASRVNLLDEQQDCVTGRWQHHVLMEWTTPRTPRQIDDPATHNVINEDVAWIIAELHAGRSVCLALSDYPDPIQADMAGIGIRVSGIAPIFIEGLYFGCLCFDNCVDDRLWSEQEMDVLMTGAGAIGAALLRQRLFERLMRSQAEHQRAAELAQANDALKRSLNAIAVAADPRQIIAHILKIVAEQFEAPLVEYWTHSADQGVARLGLTYWQGRFFHPCDQPGHPGNTDYHDCPCFTGDRNGAHLPYCLIEDITTDTVMQEVSAQIGIDLIAWYLSRGVQRLLVLPLWLNEKTIGALDIWLPSDRHFSRSQIELASTFGQQITLASYLNQLFEEAKQTVLFEERNRIASDIHDTLAQAFTGISLQLEVAKPLVHQEPNTAEQILHHISQLAKNGLDEARRSVWALYPPGTEYANLAHMLYDSVEQMSRNTPIGLDVTILGEPCPLAPSIGMNLLRIGQEAVTNALKHSQAQTVLIELTYTPELVSLSIRDDGRGFVPPTNLDNLNGGFGLVGMYERCDRIGAQLSILSQPGQGTQILVESPLFST